MTSPRSGSTAATRSLAMFAGRNVTRIDEQELLLDPQREVGLEAEAVLHGDQSTAGARISVQSRCQQTTL